MLSDFRYALRALLRAPAFSLIAIVTLALCIGANSAIFSVIHSVLLKPYPWPGSERLVYCYNTYPLAGLENAGISIPDFLDRSTQVEGFADAAIYNSQSFNLTEGTEPERVVGLVASPSIFSTLQTGAALGRVLTQDDAILGATKTVVLSHGLWTNRFGAEADVVGRTIRLNGEPHVVVGVMPSSFYFPTPRVQLWVPFVFTDAQRSDNERGTEFSSMIARLKPGVAPESIQRELDLIQARNAQRLPGQAAFWNSAGFGGRIGGFLEQNVGEVRGMLWLIQGGVAAALLIGCANVSSLLLARAVGRERELAIRAALGAGRARLVRLLVSESLLLFSAGGVLGLLVGLWGVDLLGSSLMSNLPRAFAIELDVTVFALTLLSALACGLVFGALPAWSAAKSDAAAALKEAGSRGTAGRRTQMLRSALVVAEIALAVMLLSTAGLLMKSFQRLQEQNPGFNAEQVLTARMSLPDAKYDHPDKIVGFQSALLSTVRALPGVKAAGFTTILPFTGNNSSGTYSSPEIILPEGSPAPHANIRAVDAGYLEAIGLRLMRGRWIQESDTASSPKVVVIDQLLANRYWPGEDPIGRHISRDLGFNNADALATIVGVVAPIKMQTLEENVTKETLYFPLAQTPSTGVTLVVRSEGDPTALTASLRAAVRQVDPEQPIFDVKTMPQRMDEVAQTRRAPMLLLSSFSSVAILLAALGVYGVLAFAVAQRTTEFGVRLALGATTGDIASLVIRDAARLIGVGVALGMLGYVFFSRIVESLLFGVSALDPVTLALAPALLATIGLVAGLIPALRATRVDPMIALRAE